MNLPEVREVEVDFAAKTATVTCKPGNQLTRAAVERALRDGGGYGVTSFAPVDH